MEEGEVSLEASGDEGFAALGQTDQAEDVAHAQRAGDRGDWRRDGGGHRILGGRLKEMLLRAA